MASEDIDRFEVHVELRDDGMWGAVLFPILEDGRSGELIDAVEANTQSMAIAMIAERMNR